MFIEPGKERDSTTMESEFAVQEDGTDEGSRKARSAP